MFCVNAETHPLRRMTEASPIVESLVSGQCTFVGPTKAAWIYAFSMHGLSALVLAIPAGFLLHRWRSCSGPTSTQSNPTAWPWGCRIVGLVAAISVFAARPWIVGWAPASSPECVWFGPFVVQTIGYATFFKACIVATGRFPEGADLDTNSWLQWCTMLPEPRFDKLQPRKMTSRELRSKLLDCCVKIAIIFVGLTVLLPKGSPRYDLVESSSSNNIDNNGSEVSSSSSGTIRSSWMADHINGFVHIWFFYGWASLLLDVSVLNDALLSGGKAMERCFDNPLLASRSLTEAWGTRWNQPVHLLLKRGIYEPARSSGMSKGTAALLTFVGSGLLHEYNFLAHNYPAINDGVYRVGSVTLFFLVMGGLMVAESIVYNKCLPRPVRNFFRNLPSPLTATLLCLLVSGPAERYFFRSFTYSGFVECAATMFPHLDCR